MAFGATRRTQFFPSGLPGRLYGSFSKAIYLLGEVIVATVSGLTARRTVTALMVQREVVLLSTARRTVGVL